MLNQRLRALRQARGLSQVDLARELGVTPPVHGPQGTPTPAGRKKTAPSGKFRKGAVLLFSLISLGAGSFLGCSGLLDHHILDLQLSSRPAPGTAFLKSTILQYHSIFNLSREKTIISLIFISRARFPRSFSSSFMEMLLMVIFNLSREKIQWYCNI